MYKNKFMNMQKQKVPLSVVTWRALSKCTLKVTSTLFDSAESVVNDSTSSVSNDWKIGLDIPVDPSVTIGAAFGGSHSKESTFAMQRSNKDRYTFFRHAVDCNFYWYNMVSNPPFNHEFDKPIKSLPSYSQSTETQYRNLIDTYGTHYITQVSLGGQIKDITAMETCEAAIDGLTATEVGDCLKVEASASFAQTASIRAMYQHCQAKKKKLGGGQNFNSRFNDRYVDVIGGNINNSDLFNGQSNHEAYSDWLNSLKTMPDVVQYKLKPLHTMVANYHVRDGVKKEVEKYIKKMLYCKNAQNPAKLDTDPIQETIVLVSVTVTTISGQTAVLLGEVLQHYRFLNYMQSSYMAMYGLRQMVQWRSHMAVR
ncbi:hypothetical protein LDENG_00001140 [Lucifuga dentata]|nr:hypothetical protein LDENG_00001140 [Lucifuga dentata]